jgi:hypothetical protein
LSVNGDDGRDVKAGTLQEIIKWVMGSASFVVMSRLNIILHSKVGRDIPFVNGAKYISIIPNRRMQMEIARRNYRSQGLWNIY